MLQLSPATVAVPLARQVHVIGVRGAARSALAAVVLLVAVAGPLRGPAASGRR